MTTDKAREFFSAYHEGTLEPGLRASLERKLREDAALQAEYDAFARTLDVLGGLRLEKVEVPFYLNDRISARLDAARDAKPVPFWASWFAPRPNGARLGYAVGLAATLLVASVGLRNMRSEEPVSPATLGAAGTEAVRWSKADGGALVQFQGANARTLAVVPQGGEAQVYKLADRQPFDLTLSNANRLARRFEVVEGGKLFATVAVPGKSAVRQAGTGTVDELASALANAYHVVVVVKGTPADATVRWSFDGPDAFTAAKNSLEKGNVLMTREGVLQIGE